MKSAPASAKDREQLLRLQARAMPERRLQASIVADARKLGVRYVYHPWRSDHSEKGWPDLILLYNGRGIAAELKAEGKPLPAEQERWLHELALVPGLRAYCWRPSDYLAGRVTEALLWLAGRSEA